MISKDTFYHISEACIEHINYSNKLYNTGFMSNETIFDNSITKIMSTIDDEIDSSGEQMWMTRWVLGITNPEGVVKVPFVNGTTRYFSINDFDSYYYFMNEHIGDMRILGNV